MQEEDLHLKLMKCTFDEMEMEYLSHPHYSQRVDRSG